MIWRDRYGESLYLVSTYAIIVFSIDGLGEFGENLRKIKSISNFGSLYIYESCEKALSVAVSEIQRVGNFKANITLP